MREIPKTPRNHPQGDGGKPLPPKSSPATQQTPPPAEAGKTSSPTEAREARAQRRARLQQEVARRRANREALTRQKEAARARLPQEIERRRTNSEALAQQRDAARARLPQEVEQRRANREALAQQKEAARARLPQEVERRRANREILEQQKAIARARLRQELERRRAKREVPPPANGEKSQRGVEEVGKQPENTEAKRLLGKDTNERQQIAGARNIIAEIRRVSVATATSDGMPHNSSVVTAHDKEGRYYWLARRDAPLSRNIASNENVSFTIYDSNLPSSAKDGAYIQARAMRLTDEQQVLHGLRTLANAAPGEVPRGGDPRAYLGNDSPMGIYRADPQRLWVSAHEVVREQPVDIRKEIALRDVFGPENPREVTARPGRSASDVPGPQGYEGATKDRNEHQQIAEAKRIMAEIHYPSLATATPDGMPHNSPVFAVRDEKGSFYWASSTDAQHSNNIVNNENVSFTIFDSKVAGGMEVHIQARAVTLNDKQQIFHAVNDVLGRGAASTIASQTPIDRDPRVLRYSGDSPRRIYRADPQRLWVRDGVDAQLREVALRDIFGSM